ncbi:MAG: YihY/virulence factor BrkB family protein [Armatimonadota bacterium]
MITKYITYIYDFMREVFAEYNRDHGTLFAAAISFFGLISFIPLVLLAVGVFGIIIGSYDMALETVLKFARDFIPIDIHDVETYLRGLSSQSKVLSGLGLLGLLWSGTQVFVILQQVMNVALGVRENISFLRGRWVALLIVASAGILFLVSIAFTSIIIAGRHYQLPGFRPDDMKSIWDFISVLIPVIISTLAFTLIYKYLPTRSIGTSGPIAGGIAAGIFLEIAKYVFRFYVLNITRFHAVYGSLGSVVVLVFWTYYVAVIAVLGAEVASVYVKRIQKYSDGDVETVDALQKSCELQHPK